MKGETVSDMYKSEHCEMLDDFFSAGPELPARLDAARDLLTRNANRPLSATTGQIADLEGFPQKDRVQGEVDAFEANWLAIPGADAMMRARYLAAINQAKDNHNPEKSRAIESFWISEPGQAFNMLVDASGETVKVYVRTPLVPPGGDPYIRQRSHGQPPAF
jgi:hypothetical protein